MPTKQRYRVLIPSGIEYPTDPDIIKEIEAGGNPGFDRRGHKHVNCGRIVDDIPRKSIPILLRKKWIELADGEGHEHARGGPVNAEQTYLVGERGPEMVVPSVTDKTLPKGGE